MSAIPRRMSAIPRRTSYFDNLSFSECEESPSQEQKVEVSRTLPKGNVRGIADVGQFGLAALPWLRLPSEANPIDPRMRHDRPALLRPRRRSGQRQPTNRLGQK